MNIASTTSAASSRHAFDHNTQAAAETLSTVTVVWSIARNAVRQAMPDLEIEPAARGRESDIELCITATRSACSAELRDALTDTSHPIEIGAIEIETIRAGEFMHVTVRDGQDTLLAATVRHQGDTSRLLYARTSLFDRLGIHGGRYARPALRE